MVIAKLVCVVHFAMFIHQSGPSQSEKAEECCLKLLNNALLEQDRERQFLLMESAREYFDYHGIIMRRGARIRVARLVGLVLDSTCSLAVKSEVIDIFRSGWDSDAISAIQSLREFRVFAARQDKEDSAKAMGLLTGIRYEESLDYILSQIYLPFRLP